MVRKNAGPKRVNKISAAFIIKVLILFDITFSGNLRQTAAGDY